MEECSEGKGCVAGVKGGGQPWKGTWQQGQASNVGPSLEGQGELQRCTQEFGC